MNDLLKGDNVLAVTALVNATARYYAGAGQVTVTRVLEEARSILRGFDVLTKEYRGRRMSYVDLGIDDQLTVCYESVSDHGELFSLNSVLGWTQDVDASLSDAGTFTKGT